MLLDRTDGEHSRTRLVSAADVVRLRERAAAGVSDELLASEFGLAVGHVASIRAGRVWRGVGGPLTQRATGRKKR